MHACAGKQLRYGVPSGLVIRLEPCLHHAKTVSDVAEIPEKEFIPATE